MKNYWELKKLLPNSVNHNVINQYLFSIKATRSQKTIEEYRIKLQCFFKECNALYSSITMYDIENWLSEKQKGKKNSDDYLTTLRCFYNFCVKQGFMKESPIKNKKIINNAMLKIRLPNMENQNVINAFLKNKETYRSQKTIQGYQYELRYFFKDINTLFSSITIVDIEKWITEYQKGRKKTTIDKCLTVLRSFYGFCVEQGYMRESPFRRKKKKYWEVKKPFSNEENKNRINEFLYHIKDRKSKNIIEDYRISLQLFFRKNDAHYSSITTAEILEWITKYQEGREKGTVRKILTSLRYFYRFCVQQSYVKESPIKNIHKREAEKYWKLSKSLANEENQAVINEFLLSMKVTNLSQKTILNYRFFLEKFFLDKEETFSSLESDDIQLWFIKNQKHLVESSIKPRLSALSSFYTFCVEEGYLEKSPIKFRWYPRIPKPVPKFLEKKEISKVRQKSEEEILRNRFLVEFLLTSGCRVGEVHQINREDVNLEERTAQVKGKGKKIRLVHFSEKCALLLERYLEWRKDDHPALVVSAWERRLSINQMREIIGLIGKKAGLSGSLYPHRLRHTFATELLAKGADLSFIADQLGHKDLQTTKIYAHLPKREMISLYRKYMG